MDNFLTTADLTRDQLEALVSAAIKLKSGSNRERVLQGRSVALVFFNPSLRTRASMQVGIFDLAQHAQYVLFADAHCVSFRS